MQSPQRPVLVDVHGYSSNPWYVKRLQSITSDNDNVGSGWLIALPYGTACKPTTTCCAATETEATCQLGGTLDSSNPCAFNAGGCCGFCSIFVDDIAFMKALSLHLINRACADPENVFATGFSNGGMLSNRIGCQLSGIFKAVVPHSGSRKYGGGFLSCNPEVLLILN